MDHIQQQKCFISNKQATKNEEKEDHDPRVSTVKIMNEIFFVYTAKLSLFAATSITTAKSIRL